MSVTATRRGTSLVLASLFFLGGTVTGGVAVAAEAGATAATAFSCNVTGGLGRLTAGYYDGDTAIPSSSQVTAAGKEAQCLLKYRGYDPGTVDGIFGPRSQAAARAFQHSRNTFCEAGLREDGSVGPKTWPWLRASGC